MQVSFFPCSCAMGCPWVYDAGIGWPFNSASRGLWSKVSRVRRPARHAQEDDTLGSRSEVERRDDARLATAGACRGVGQQRGERRHPDTAGRPAEKGAPGLKVPHLFELRVLGKSHHSQLLVIVSWRFKRTRATDVQEASSVIGTSFGIGESPTLSNASAAGSSVE